ncbi:hypothetical protein LDENG_00263750 [Lucifuga dentata]|nr:hypothetical protein LDENG_00263750 [Lucifuga dentata]
MLILSNPLKQKSTGHLCQKGGIIICPVVVQPSGILIGLNCFKPESGEQRLHTHQLHYQEYKIRSEMEVKVSVDGVQRVVCGVAEETTCQDVVIALAQALGQPGRYTLREKFKDFERSMTPNERLLESLQKYGQQAREVQLTLLHNGASRTAAGRYQPHPPMRRKDAAARVRRGSGSHRRSLPPLSCLRRETEQPPEDEKRQKRKSLTFMEEAWGWLESLGKGKVYSTAWGKESDKRNETSMDASLSVDKDASSRGSLLSKVKGQKGTTSDLDHQTSCCMGSQLRGKESKISKKTPGSKSDDFLNASRVTIEDEKDDLREKIVWQLTCLQDLQVQIASVDKQMMELEEQQRARKVEQEVQQKLIEEELEQIEFWENELKAEEVYEEELHHQFLEMKEKAAECKAKLEEYKLKTHETPDFSRTPNVLQGSEIISESDKNAAAANATVSVEDSHQQRSDRHGDVNTDRKFSPKENFKPPHALVPPNQIKERRLTGPTQLREWWTRWAEAQSSKSEPKRKMIHRSELTIFLSSTKV